MARYFPAGFAHRSDIHAERPEKRAPRLRDGKTSLVNLAARRGTFGAGVGREHNRPCSQRRPV